MPACCEPQATLLAALARAAQLTAEQLKAEEADRERKLMGVV
jgi:transglutaminase-like putative cysteine protease